MRSLSIWWFAFGYFACYVPYSALVKLSSSGVVEGVPELGNLELLPWAYVSAMLTSFLFITATGWWKHANRRVVFGRSLPWPTRWTALSGLCSSTVIVTTTLAYTFDGVSIVFIMLLMRGGLLVMAPLVDAITGRHVRPTAWVALGLSLASLLVAFFGKGASVAVTAIVLIDVAIYLAAYFVRLRFMSRLAKTPDPAVAKRYFVEEQMVATPALVTLLALAALIGPDSLSAPLRDGWTLDAGGAGLLMMVGIGVCSQGTGIFGGLVLLDSREHSFSVPVNRASSMISGVVATLLLAAIFGKEWPSTSQYVATALVVAAILALSLPGVLAARRRSAAT